MKFVLGLFVIVSFFSLAEECDSQKLVIAKTKKAMVEFAKIPDFAAFKSITQYQSAQVHSGDESVSTYSIAGLDSRGNIIALGASSVDLAKCDLVENRDGSAANSFSLQIFKDQAH